MATFVFAHGGSHGGWCWEEVVPRLRAAGHLAVTPDLPIEDPEAGASAWAKVLCDAAGDAEDVVLVGHSMGGMALPVAASMRPVDRMVFVCASVPVPGMSYSDYLEQTQPASVTLDFSRLEIDALGRSVIPDEAAIEYFYHDCPPEVARSACKRLRPTAMTVFGEVCPIDEWPTVPSTYILGTKDRVVSPAWSRMICRDRLDVVPVELHSGHSPFLAVPDVFTEALVRVAGNGSR